jgi:hypothetical protein
LHGIFDNGGGAEVAWVEDVGDVAVHEDVAGLEAQEGGFRAARVGAPDPQNLRRLPGGKGREKLGVAAGCLCSPFLVQAQACCISICGSRTGDVSLCLGFWALGFGLWVLGFGFWGRVFRLEGDSALVF